MKMRSSGARLLAPASTAAPELTELSPASRTRAAVASFTKRASSTTSWPSTRWTASTPSRLPRPAAAADVAKVSAVICSRWPRKDLPLDRLQDRVLFETAYVCGTRAFEVCGLYVEDLDLRLDDEHVRIHGKGGSVRTVLLDDRGYVTLLKLYLTRAGYAAARVEIDIHQLRHAYATELINAGVSIEAVRRRLGHASAETTQIHALLDDKVADAEVRAARRRRGQSTH
ncbi:tyrosine-type recombinase/integrase [Nonomuraea fuscirosea]|uniref:tyrosine-type recombinase/integrase n=1 Tax=Nonomuraea fuscirosea TaxID=1291556 RepID=UPI00341DCA42